MAALRVSGAAGIFPSEWSASSQGAERCDHTRQSEGSRSSSGAEAAKKPKKSGETSMSSSRMITRLGCEQRSREVEQGLSECPTSIWLPGVFVRGVRGRILCSIRAPETLAVEQAP